MSITGKILRAIKALIPLHLARTLSEPELATSNGQAVSFRAGGQLMFPLAQRSQLLPFDLELTLVPVTSSDRDRIRLAVQARVGLRDQALSERQFRTQMELHEGQSLVLAEVVRYPGSQSGPTPVPENEVVLVVTPEFSASLDGKGDKETRRPGDRETSSSVSLSPGLPVSLSPKITPTDLDFYLLHGRVEDQLSAQPDRAPLAGPARASTLDPGRLQRYYRCEEALICGPHGYTDGARK